MKGLQGIEQRAVLDIDGLIGEDAPKEMRVFAEMCWLKGCEFGFSQGAQQGMAFSTEAMSEALGKLADTLREQEARAEATTA